MNTLEVLAIVLSSIALLIGVFTIGHMRGYSKGIKDIVKHFIAHNVFKSEEDEETEDEQAD